MMKNIIPLLRMRINKLPNHVGIAKVQGGVKMAPKFVPEVAKKFDVTIESNGMRDTMGLYDLTKEQVGNMFGIISLAARDEVQHLRETLNHNQNEISMSRDLRKAENEVHTNVFLNVLWIGKQCKEAEGESEPL